MTRGEHRARGSRGVEDGAAAVEFALIVIPLLLVVFGIINFGLIFASQISLNSAARDAARAGVVQPLSGTGMTCAQIANLARESAGTIGAPKTNIAVTVTGPGSSPKSCSLPAGSSTVTGNATATLCTASSAVTSPQLTVLLTNAYVSPVGLVPPGSLTQTATGRFQCEYT